MDMRIKTQRTTISLDEYKITLCVMGFHRCMKANCVSAYEIYRKRKQKWDMVGGVIYWLGCTPNLPNLAKQGQA